MSSKREAIGVLELSDDQGGDGGPCEACGLTKEGWEDDWDDEDWDDEEGLGSFEPIEIEGLEQTLAGEGPDHWLWCLYCHRFFQARHVRRDYLGNMQGCAFCGAAGFNVALFSWDTWRNPHEPWPRSTEELRHGMRLKIETMVRMIAVDDEGVGCGIVLDEEDRYCLTVERPRQPRIKIVLTRSERWAVKRRQLARVERLARNVVAAPERYRKRFAAPE